MAEENMLSAALSATAGAPQLRSYPSSAYRSIGQTFHIFGDPGSNAVTTAGIFDLLKVTVLDIDPRRDDDASPMSS